MASLALVPPWRRQDRCCEQINIERYCCMTLRRGISSGETGQTRSQGTAGWSRRLVIPMGLAKAEKDLPGGQQKPSESPDQVSWTSMIETEYERSDRDVQTP